MGTAFGDSVMAFSGVVGAICRDTGNVLIGRDLGQQFGQHGRVAYVAAGDLDRPNLPCFLIDPKMDLSPDASLGTAMLARVPLAFCLDLDPLAGSLEPVALTGSLSIKRCNGPCEPRCGMFTASVFWRRLRVLKSGTSQSRPTNRNRLSTNPPRHGLSDQWRSHGSICRRAMPNRTFIVRQVWTAASL